MWETFRPFRGKIARSCASHAPFRCQSQPRPRPSRAAPCRASRDLCGGSTLSGSTSTTRAWLRRSARPTCTTEEEGQGRCERRLCFAVLTLSRAQSRLLGKIWQLPVFYVCVCVGVCAAVLVAALQSSSVTLGAALKTNCNIRQLSHGSSLVSFFYF